MSQPMTRYAPLGNWVAGTFASVLASCALEGSPSPGSSAKRVATDGSSVNWLMFHGDRFRSGWNPVEWILTPSAVATGNFGKLWDTGGLDLDPSGNPPHFYASPLYVDVVTLTTPDLRGLPFHVVIAASTAGYVYAINAFDANGIPPGRVLWSTFLGRPAGGGDRTGQERNGRGRAQPGRVLDRRVPQRRRP